MHATDTDGSAIREALIDALRARDLLPGAAAYHRVASRVRASGADQRHALVTAIGEECWQAILAAVPVPDAERRCLRILGFGDALTRFIVAPADPPRAFGLPLAALGARAQLIVSLFDACVDSGLPPNEVLALEDLERAIASHGEHPGHGPRFDRALLLPLVTDYLHLLQAECIGDGPLPGDIAALILRMYSAELATLPDGDQDQGSLRVKSSAPFVLIGLPAMRLLPDPPGPVAFREWLEELGTFLGEVDDVADLDDDRRRGHANATAPLGSFTDAAALQELAATIAQRGARVRDRWLAWVPTDARTREELATFKTCIASWLGLTQDAMRRYPAGAGPDPGEPRAGR